MTMLKHHPDLGLDTVRDTLPDEALIYADGPVILIGNGAVDAQQLRRHHGQTRLSLLMAGLILPMT